MVKKMKRPDVQELDTEEQKPSLLDYGMYSPGSKWERPSSQGEYTSVSDVLGEKILEEKQNTSDFLSNMLNIITDLQKKVKNPDLKLKLAIFESDLYEIQENLSILMARDYSSLSRERGQLELADDIKNTFAMIHQLELQRGLSLIGSVRNQDILSPHQTIITEWMSDLLNLNLNLNLNSYIDVKFSQDNATDRFKNSQVFHTSSNEILGAKVEDVGENIRRGELPADVLKVRIFCYKGHWVAENNRGYAASCISEKFPERLLPTFPEQLILNTYEERLKNSSSIEPFYTIQLIDANSGKVSKKVSVCSEWREEPSAPLILFT
jgi:hypothetical protein